MKKMIARSLVLAVLAIAVFAQKDNPFQVWCDYHNAWLSKQGKEFPNGVCYDVYKHTYYSTSCKCFREHKATMKCSK